jgi:hypothetical protein
VVDLEREVFVLGARGFWGDRTAWIMDPAGQMWTIAAPIEKMTAEQRAERWDKILDESR